MARLSTNARYKSSSLPARQKTVLKTSHLSHETSAKRIQILFDAGTPHPNDDGDPDSAGDNSHNKAGKHRSHWCDFTR